MKTLLKAIAVAAITIAAGTTSAQAASGEFTLASLGKIKQVGGWVDVLEEGKLVKASTVSKRDRSPVSRQIIKYDRKVKVGTIIVDNSDRRLYHVISKGVAMVYGIAVGRDGFRWTGVEKVTSKTEWPSWNPPAEMRAREAKRGHILPERMEGGANNPLGARALYLGSTEYRIHGTNMPSSIGKAASSGCIRMANEDVKHLYAHVQIGATVIVQE